MISLIFAAAAKDDAESDFDVFVARSGKTLVSRSAGESVKYFEYRPSDSSALSPEIDPFSVSRPDPPKPMYVIYAVFR